MKKLCRHDKGLNQFSQRVYWSDPNGKLDEAHGSVTVGFDKCLFCKKRKKPVRAKKSK